MSLFFPSVLPSLSPPLYCSRSLSLLLLLLCLPLSLSRSLSLSLLRSRRGNTWLCQLHAFLLLIYAPWFHGRSLHSHSSPLPTHPRVKKKQQTPRWFVTVLMAVMFFGGKSTTKSWRGAPRGLLQCEMRLDWILFNFNDSSVANWCRYGSRKNKTHGNRHDNKRVNNGLFHPPS